MSSASFGVSVGAVSTDQTASVTATLGSVSKTAVLTISGTTGGTGSADASLVGYWKLNEGSGTVALDSSGNGGDGTLVNNPVWTTGQAGSGALQFSGTNWVRVSSCANLAIKGNAISFGAWYYHTSSAKGFLLGKTVTDYSYMMSVDQGSQQFNGSVKTGGNLNSVAWPKSKPNGLKSYENTWVHVFVVYDGAQITLYVNGAAKANVAASGAVQSNNDAFAIGARGGDGSWTPFNGKMEEVRVYNRALSAQEVQAVYDGTAASPVTPPASVPVISSFTATPGSISAGGTSTLAWNVTGATSLSIDQGVGTVTGLTSKAVSPAATTTYTLTATNSAGSVTSTAAVTVAAVPATLLSSLVCTPSSLNSGSAATCTVSLSGNAAASTAISLSSSQTAVSVPASVTVAAGAASATFSATAGTVATSTTAILTASLNGVSQTASITAAPAAQPAGLVGYWSLNDGSGTVAADSSGNGGDGALVNNPVWTTGQAGSGALQFSGTNWVRVPSSPSLAIKGSAISFGAWYYHTSSAKGYLLGKTVTDYSYMMSVDQGSQQFNGSVKTGGNLNSVAWPASAPGALKPYENTWVHVFVVYDGAQITLYVNGAAKTKVAASGAVQSNNDAFAIGARGGDGSWAPFNGKIDEVQVYDRALSAQEVQAVYGGTAASPDNGTPLPPASLPAISSFTATPASISAGGASTLAWNVSGATSLSIDQGVGTVTGLTSKAVSPAATTTYTLTATNSAGSVTSTAAVTVAVPTAPPSGPATITLYPSMTHQTIVGWEAVAQAGQVDCSGFNNYSSSLFDQAVNDLGINRLRVELAANSDGWTFNLTGLDDELDRVVLPMRQRLAARGEKLFVNVNFGGKSNFPNDITRYAPQVVAVYQHMQSKYGFVPDAWEIALEPTVVSPYWTPQNIGDAMLSTGQALTAAGFSPYLIGPSTPSGAGTALPWFDTIAQHSPSVFPYFREFSYHRYGETDSYLPQVASRGTQYGINTAQLEHLGGDYNELHKDLTIGNVSAWQQYALAYCVQSDDGAQYYVANGGAVTLGAKSKFLRQYFRFIRAGAVRIDAQTVNTAFSPAAFRNTNGKYVVVVNASTGGSFSITGLAAGTYGVKYTTGSQYDVNASDIVVGTGGSLSTSIPASGVLTVYAK